MWEKEKKIEDFKKKKREMLENKAKIANDMEKEKQELIVKFENAFKKNKQVETSLIEEFYYPKKGPGQLYEAMAKKIREMGGEIL